MLSKGFLPNVISERIICEFHHPLNWSDPSIFKSAGQNFLNNFSSLGYPSAAQLETPESNHTSRTSGTLFNIFPDLFFISILSISGLCNAILLLPESFFSSFMLPTTIFSLLSGSYQIGRGVPQYLCLEIGQSPIPSSHAFIFNFI